MATITLQERPKMRKGISVTDSVGKSIKRFNSRTMAEQFKQQMQQRYPSDVFGIELGCSGKVSGKYKATGELTVSYLPWKERFV